MPDGNYIKSYVYRCDDCGCTINDGDPYYKINNKPICCDCSYKKGIINEKEYLKHCGYGFRGERVGISPISGEIEITNNKYFSWEKSTQSDRSTTDYKAWRKAVFERDNYTCKICNKKGGTLNAHHLKSYSKYKNLRFEVSNGVTLCEKCHKNIHKSR